MMGYRESSKNAPFSPEAVVRPSLSVQACPAARLPDGPGQVVGGASRQSACPPPVSTVAAGPSWAADRWTLRRQIESFSDAAIRKFLARKGGARVHL